MNDIEIVKLNSLRRLDITGDSKGEQEKYYDDESRASMSVFMFLQKMLEADDNGYTWNGYISDQMRRLYERQLFLLLQGDTAFRAIPAGEPGTIWHPCRIRGNDRSR